MTGFGRGEFKTDNVQCVAEIKTVNHRYSDFTIKLPRELMSLEDRVRSELKRYVQRGKTDVYITYTDLTRPYRHISVDENLVMEYFSAIKSAADSLGYAFRPDMSMLFKMPDAFVQTNVETDQESAWNAVSQALCVACENLIIMREREGARLEKELRSILSNTELFFGCIKKRSGLVPLEYKDKLNARLTELLDAVPVDEQRLAAEVAIFADKCSIDEEIARLESHIRQFEGALDSAAPEIYAAESLIL